VGGEAALDSKCDGRMAEGIVHFFAQDFAAFSDFCEHWLWPPVIVESRGLEITFAKPDSNFLWCLWGQQEVSGHRVFYCDVHESRNRVITPYGSIGKVR
jgi:hypothetical protein